MMEIGSSELAQRAIEKADAEREERRRRREAERRLIEKAVRSLAWSVTTSRLRTWPAKPACRWRRSSATSGSSVTSRISSDPRERKPPIWGNPSRHYSPEPSTCPAPRPVAEGRREEDGHRAAGQGSLGAGGRMTSPITIV